MDGGSAEVEILEAGLFPELYWTQAISGRSNILGAEGEGKRWQIED
jgi:hypothetical protein